MSRNRLIGQMFLSQVAVTEGEVDGNAVTVSGNWILRSEN